MQRWQTPSDLCWAQLGTFVTHFPSTKVLLPSQKTQIVVVPTTVAVSQPVPASSNDGHVLVSELYGKLPLHFTHIKVSWLY